MKTTEEQIDYIRHQFIEDPPKSLGDFFFVPKPELVAYMRRLEYKLAELYSLIDKFSEDK